jgi:hypothetical protein
VEAAEPDTIVLPAAAPVSTPHAPRPLVRPVPVPVPADAGAWLSGRRYALAISDRPPKHLAQPAAPAYRPRHLASPPVHRFPASEGTAAKAS